MAAPNVCPSALGAAASIRILAERLVVTRLGFNRCAAGVSEGLWLQVPVDSLNVPSVSGGWALICACRRRRTLLVALGPVLHACAALGVEPSERGLQGTGRRLPPIRLTDGAPGSACKGKGFAWRSVAIR